ncbi:hypothetical protein V8B97DRAFT_1917247 [Scleroderma yunnanense]
MSQSSRQYNAPQGGNAPNHPPKKDLQKQYRDREAELFQQLQQSIRHVANRAPSTRHEILTEAIHLLSSVRNNNPVHSHAMNASGPPPQMNPMASSQSYYQTPSDIGPELDHVMMGMTSAEYYPPAPTNNYPRQR